METRRDPVRRLGDATLPLAPADVRRPAYDRRTTSVGVVHFGPGAFHRAHQAWYFDRMLAADPGLAVCAVSLRSPDLRDALAPQDGLYALVERRAEPAVEVIGSIRELRVAHEDPEAVLAHLAAVRFVTATVTEKGYCLTAGGDLDADHPDVRHDLQAPSRPRSLVGWIAEGLRRRHAARTAPFVTLSCDNLSQNGAKLGRAVAAFAELRGDRDLARWIEDEARFPSTMVDSITPATDAPLRDLAAARLGLVDAWPVQRERFVQWVAEDSIGPEASLFAAAGVTVARSAAPYEKVKLRLLNGAHSTLAYLGLSLGSTTVAEAMAHPPLARFVERMMRRDIQPTLGATEVDVPAYIDSVLARFREPAIVHRLSQIAWDGSQKLRFRMLETCSEALDAGRPIDRLVVGIAAWMAFVVDRTRAGVSLVDPLAGQLAAVARASDGSVADVDRFLALGSIFPRGLSAAPGFRIAVQRAYRGLRANPETVLSR